MVCDKDKFTADIIRMCEEVAETFVSAMERCERSMEFKAFTIRKFEKDEDDKFMKHYVDLFTTGFVNAVDDRTDLHMTTFDLDMTIEDSGDDVELWFYAKRKE
jgi:hypothetical protein